MPDDILAPTLVPLVALFADCFTAPSFQTFQMLLSGWILCLGRHAVTGVLLASGAVGKKHYTSFQRFFRSAAWSVEALGVKLLTLVDGDGPLVVGGRHARAAHWQARPGYLHAP